MVTVVARVGLAEVVEVEEVVKVGVPTGTICMGVAVALTGVGVRKVGVKRSNCSSLSFRVSLRSSGGGGPFRRVYAFMVAEQPWESIMVVCLNGAQKQKNRQGSLSVAAPRKLRILILEFREESKSRISWSK